MASATNAPTERPRFSRSPSGIRRSVWMRAASKAALLAGVEGGQGVAGGLGDGGVAVGVGRVGRRHQVLLADLLDRVVRVVHRRADDREGIAGRQHRAGLLGRAAAVRDHVRLDHHRIPLQDHVHRRHAAVLEGVQAGPEPRPTFGLGLSRAILLAPPGASHGANPFGAASSGRPRRNPLCRADLPRAGCAPPPGASPDRCGRSPSPATGSVVQGGPLQRDGGAPGPGKGCRSLRLRPALKAMNSEAQVPNDSGTSPGFGKAGVRVPRSAEHE